MSDAWGAGGTLLVHPDGVSLAQRAAAPYTSGGALREASVVIDQFDGSDLVTQPSVVGEAIGARLVVGTEIIATWNGADDSAEKTGGGMLPAAGRVWCAIISSIYSSPTLKAECMVLRSTAALRPPIDASPEEGHRFPNDAAELMPDAGHIDLIGQHMIKYVTIALTNAPTADRQHRGSLRHSPDRLANLGHGGQRVCRGDHDDVSEIYQEIADRQNKLAYVIALPDTRRWPGPNNAMIMACVRSSNRSRLEFIASDLADALGQAYGYFDSSESFDPNAVGLLLRFSGEHLLKLAPVLLIFTDQVYADTMIDVQKDWHYQTYLQGIDKMRAPVDAGDEDNANYRELAGLYSFTGQHD